MDLRKVLKRFTKQQLCNDVWEVLNIRDVAKPNVSRSSKEELINYIIKIAKGASCDIKKLVILLEMKGCQIQMRKRQWAALEIKNQEFYVEKTTNAENFAKKLNKFLNRSKLFCEVISEFFNDVLWTAVSVRQRQSQSTFFLLAYNQLPIVLYTHMKASNQEILKRSLVQLFRGTDCKALSMSSKNVNTLLLFAFKKANLSDKLQDNPIFKKLEKNINDPPKLPSNIVNEDDDEEKERKLYLENTFGCFEQPAIESLTYNISSEFYGFDKENKPFNVISRTVLKGGNVLEGIQQLVQLGVSDFPLPEYLTNVIEYGTNRFNITFKGNDSIQSINHPS